MVGARLDHLGDVTGAAVFVRRDSLSSAGYWRDLVMCLRKVLLVCVANEGVLLLAIVLMRVSLRVAVN